MQTCSNLENKQGQDIHVTPTKQKHKNMETSYHEEGDKFELLDPKGKEDGNKDRANSSRARFHTPSQQHISHADLNDDKDQLYGSVRIDDKMSHQHARIQSIGSRDDIFPGSPDLAIK